MSDAGRLRGEGALAKAKGAVKEGLGRVRDDESQEAEGKLDKVKGAVKEKVADARDTVDDIADKVRDNT